MFQELAEDCRERFLVLLNRPTEWVLFGGQKWAMTYEARNS
jgi:hypothetical protein